MMMTTDAAPSKDARGQPAATASETHVTGLNYMKSGSDPELGPDDAYPEWLWTLSETKESLGGYERRIADLKAAGLDWRVEFSEEDAKRYKKLERTNRIRTNNAERKKG
jgi:large subunit ribosomal protein L54|tara:strand:+ start:32068 stop:32394 length:327 start_codon:yes stop_codon:yes gene_type:complete